MIKYEVEVDSDGSRYWYLNGQYHREDGPALELDDGSRYWYLNGKRHREDGPAVEESNGTKYWYLNGMVLPEAEHKLRTMANHQQQTDLVEYIGGLSKGAELAKEEMKQKIEEKLQLWEGEGFVDKAVAASVIYNLITEKGVDNDL
jgi:hypothetical protein